MTLKSTEKQTKGESRHIKHIWLSPPSPHSTFQIVPHLIPVISGVRNDPVNALHSLCVCAGPR